MSLAMSFWLKYMSYRLEYLEELLRIYNAIWIHLC